MYYLYFNKEIMEKKRKNHLVFTIVSFINAVLFYSAFSIIFGPKHPFLKRLFLIVFLILHTTLTTTVYLSLYPRPGKTLTVFVSIPFVSLIFPLMAFLDLYPTTMAIPHLLILFYVCLSFISVISSFAIINHKKSSTRLTLLMSGATALLLGITFLIFTLYRLLLTQVL